MFKNTFFQSSFCFVSLSQRKGRSCADLLTATVDDWLLARDRKLTTAIVFLDLSKAFDNVQHEQLLLHLQKLNIGGTVLKWFSKYLKGRSQKFVLHGHVSEEFPCSKGVPQDSVLGPLLFNIHVADLHPMASWYNVSLPSFADDMSLYCSRTSLNGACSDVSTALTTISTELDRRGLKINCEKTSAMLICLRSNRFSEAIAGESSLANITCDGKTIPLVSNTRLLGVIVDSNLSWKDHVDQVCLKVNRKIGALRRTFRQLTPTARRAFFLSVIHPDLEYAASAIVPSMAVSQKNRLLATWRRAVPCAAGSGYQDNVAPLVKQLKIVSLDHRWALQVAKIVLAATMALLPQL